MTYNANGINYTSMMITDEEKAVIDAMRIGGKVDLWVPFAIKEDAKNYIDEFPFNDSVYISDHTDVDVTSLLYAGSTESVCVFTKKVTPPASNE